MSIYIFLLFVVAIAFIISSSTKNNHIGSLSNKSSSCEMFPPRKLQMGQKTKCFSCLNQALRKCGDPSAVFDELPSRYYNGIARLGYM